MSANTGQNSVDESEFRRKRFEHLEHGEHLGDAHRT